MVAARAQISRSGTKMKSFKRVATRLNADPQPMPFVNSHTISKQFETWMEIFITMRDKDEAALEMAYEFTDAEKILEDTKSQFESVQDFERTEEKRKHDQRKKITGAAKRVVANASKS